MTPPRSKNLPIRPANRVLGIRYAVRDVVVLADELRRAGKEMFYLNIGDPNIFDFETPEHVVDATHEAMRRNHNGYAPSDGIPEALEALRREASRKGITSLVHTWIGTGCSEVIDMALTALVERGENVLTPAPGYPLYGALLTKLEVESRPYFLDEDDAWQPDVSHIEQIIDERTRAIVVVNPNNPTGSVTNEKILRRILELAVEHDLLVIADEIYDRLLLDADDHVTMASLVPEASVLTLGGLSKNWVAPGFRIGWGFLSGVPEKLWPYSEGIRQLSRARLSANHPEQHAIAPALEGDQAHLGHMVAKLRERRDLAVSMLDAIDGIQCVSPRGAFYAFPRLAIDGSDAAWAADLMRATGVVVVPGSGFGQKPGTRHFRIVTLPPPEVLGEACRRIGEFMRSP